MGRPEIMEISTFRHDATDHASGSLCEVRLGSRTATGQGSKVRADQRNYTK